MKRQRPPASITAPPASQSEAGATGVAVRRRSGGVDIILLIALIACACWVYTDAQRIELATGQTVGKSSKGMWTFGTIALWIVAFPWYLVSRGKALANVPTAASFQPPAPIYNGPSRAPQAHAVFGQEGYASATPSVGPYAVQANRSSTDVPRSAHFCTTCGNPGAAAFCASCGAPQHQ